MGNSLTDDGGGLAVLVADGVDGLSARHSGLDDVGGDSGVQVGHLVIVKSNV